LVHGDTHLKLTGFESVVDEVEVLRRNAEAGLVLEPPLQRIGGYVSVFVRIELVPQLLSFFN